MIYKIKLFLADHKITAHSAALAWIWIVQFYFNNVEARSYLDYYAHEIYTHFPHWFQGLIVSVIIPAIIYWKTTKKPTT